ncbi:TonB-dependent vitamin B12 receptor [Urechidicola sp. KH5]
MKKQTLRVSVMCALFAVFTANAQEQDPEIEQLDEVVLSDTKFELKKENSGKIIYKISQEEIAQSAGLTISDLLDQVPGIDINGNNNVAGSPISIYIRGGRNHQAAIVIDGILVNNPTGIAASYNLNLINLNDVESIEILKGSSSTLYGSGAAAGVINIKMKKAAQKPVSVNYTATIGTNDSQENRTSNLKNLTQQFGINGSVEKFDYLVNLAASKSDGLSAASDANSDTPFEDDAFVSNNAMVKLNYALSNRLKVGVFGHFNQYDYDYDAGAFADSDINNGNEKENRYGVVASYEYDKGELKATGSWSDLERGFDSYNGWTDTVDNYLYEGKTVFAEIINKYEFSENFFLIAGINYQEFSNNTNTPFGDIDKDLANFNVVDPFVNVVYNRGKFNLNAGARLNNHSEYGSHFVYNVNPSYNLISKEDLNVKVLASYSTAFIAPSTYQLYSQYGNLDLDPEEAATLEGGFELSNNDWLQLNALFFYRDETNRIIFVTDPVTFASQYENATGEQNVKGVEANATLMPLEKTVIDLGYTYTYKSEDVDYIPTHKWFAAVQYQPIEKLNLGASINHLGERTYFDQFGSFGDAGEDVIMDAYSLIDFNANYSCQNVTFLASLNNAFNEDYVDVLGYTTKGRNVLLGVRLNF